MKSLSGSYGASERSSPCESASGLAPSKTWPRFVAALAFVAFAIIVSSVALNLSVSAQGTAFTYQGRLNDGANLANGIYDLRFETYDAASGGSGQGRPVTNSAVSVSNGLFTVTLDFGAGVFNGPNPWLDIGVRPTGLGPFTSLVPRQPVTATPYAIRAGNVTGPINGALITAGTVTTAQLAPGAAVSNLNAAGQSGVASGGLVLSATENAALVIAGYISMGAVTTGNVWQEGGTVAPPAARQSHSAVWTGSEMIVWGGDGQAGVLKTGGRYDPAVNTWMTVNTSGAAAARRWHTAVWTDSLMVVWGGNDGTNDLNTGGRYNPVVNTWTTVSTSGAPVPRRGQTAVWTGSEMIVWGGKNDTVFLASGGRYHPVSNTWAAVSTTGAPTARSSQTAVWTGSEMIIWGGDSPSGELNTGGRYRPASNTWAPVSTTGAPAARAYHKAVWTGSEMIVWGGLSGSSTELNTGGRYDPVNNSWTTVSISGAPAARRDHTIVWAGSEMIVWGGYDGAYLSDGGRYQPAANSWMPTSTPGAPAGRLGHTSVWTGTEMIVWGGANMSGDLKDTFRYTPGRLLYLYQRP